MPNCVRIVLFCGVLMIGIAPLRSQTLPAEKPSFDVASVKPSAPGPGGGPPRVTAEAGRFVGSNALLGTVLQFAYRPKNGGTLRNGDILGLPDWANMQRFDIEAKAAGGRESVSQEQMRLLVQSLLADRFHLKAHWETREMATYNLVTGKNGAKLKLSPDQSPPGTPAPATVPPRGVVRQIARPSASGIFVTVSGDALPMDTLVSTLQSYAGRPVFDKTSLGGLFDVKLEFMLETNGVNTIPAVPGETSGPTFGTALEEQLGLKLESTKGLVEVLVIDSVARPSEN
jgi:uncharacterized protein (TIGR03435 family)